MSNKENNKEQKIQRLREEISKNFENTGLVTNVNISGSLYDETNPLHLEYHINEKGDTKKKLVELREMLKDKLTSMIQMNHPEILSIEEKVIREGKVYRQVVVSNSEYKNNAENQEERLLNDLNHYLENYLMRHKHKNAKR